VNEEGFCVYTGIWWALALPRMVIALYAAVIAALCWWSLARAPSSSMQLFCGMAAGLTVWTAFEYVLHRWLLHHVRVPVLRALFWNGLHREHHMYRSMRDPHHHAVHPAITLPLALLLTLAIGTLTSGGPGPAVLAGWLAGYVAYETLHWLFHTVEPGSPLLRIPFLRRLSKAHTVHHLVAASANYGFVTQFWDLCFGTLHRGV
jgi:sterol desaturase/sphingolipid hydroxylase (fatty acid hydroxylase superfamily)